MTRLIQNETKFCNIKAFYKTPQSIFDNQWNYFQRGCMHKWRSGDFSIQIWHIPLEAFASKNSLLKKQESIQNLSYVLLYQYITEKTDQNSIKSNDELHIICIKNMNKILLTCDAFLLPLSLLLAVKYWTSDANTKSFLFKSTTKEWYNVFYLPLRYKLLNTDIYYDWQNS